jgi:hypothetical protein
MAVGQSAQGHGHPVARDGRSGPGRGAQRRCHRHQRQGNGAERHGPGQQHQCRRRFQPGGGRQFRRRRLASHGAGRASQREPEQRHRPGLCGTRPAASRRRHWASAQSRRSSIQQLWASVPMPTGPAAWRWGRPPRFSSISTDGVAIGSNASTTVAGGVALGGGSAAGTGGGIAGYAPAGASGGSEDSHQRHHRNLTGAVAVGDAANGGVSPDHRRGRGHGQQRRGERGAVAGGADALLQRQRDEPGCWQQLRQRRCRRHQRGGRRCERLRGRSFQRGIGDGARVTGTGFFSCRRGPLARTPSPTRGPRWPSAPTPGTATSAAASTLWWGVNTGLNSTNVNPNSYSGSTLVGMAAGSNAHAGLSRHLHRLPGRPEVERRRLAGQCSGEQRRHLATVRSEAARVTGMSLWAVRPDPARPGPTTWLWAGSETGTSVNGSGNVALGSEAGQSVTGNSNVAIGSATGRWIPDHGHGRRFGSEWLEQHRVWRFGWPEHHGQQHGVHWPGCARQFEPGHCHRHWLRLLRARSRSASARATWSAATTRARSAIRTTSRATVLTQRGTTTPSRQTTPSWWATTSPSPPAFTAPWRSATTAA